MDEFLGSILFYGPFIVMGGLAVLAAVLALVAWRRVWSMEGPLPLDEMLARNGVKVPGDITPGTAYELAQAARRCAGCAAGTTCRTWLDSGARSGFDEFCPNYAFIERARHERMTLGASVL